MVVNHLTEVKSILVQILFHSSAGSEKKFKSSIKNLDF
jgi:hypothetical protein